MHNPIHPAHAPEQHLSLDAMSRTLLLSEALSHYLHSAKVALSQCSSISTDDDYADAMLEECRREAHNEAKLVSCLQRITKVSLGTSSVIKRL